MPPKGKAKGKGSKADKKAAAISAGRAKASERQKRKALARERYKEKYGSDLVKMGRELAGIGLSVREVEGDGNCMFRAVADQLGGRESDHWDLRCRAVEFMGAHREELEPFVDTDEFGSWEGYRGSMACMGEWGGNMELISLSRALGVNLCVHQLGEPRWEVTHFPPGRRRLHVSYHDGNHYNSVRMVGDGGAGGRARAFVLGPRGAEEADCEEPEDAAACSPAERHVDEAMGGSVPIEAVRRALEAAGGEEDAAVTLLVTGEVRADAAEADGGAARVEPRAGASASSRGEGGLSRKEAKAAKRRAKAARRLAEAAEGEPSPAHGGKKRKGKRSAAADAAGGDDGDEEAAAASSLAALSI